MSEYTLNDIKFNLLPLLFVRRGREIMKIRRN